MPKTTRTHLRLLALLLTLAVLFCATGCGGKKPVGKATRLSYEDFSDYEYLKTLDGTTVSISGFMTTQMPEDGSYAYLTSLPWQESPLFAPNTTRLSGAVAIYANHGTRFTHLTEAVKVIGTLEVAENEESLLTDTFGYDSYCRIVDANYVKMDASELTGDMAVWQKLAQEDFLSEINRMYDYVNFLCVWPTCYVNPTGDKPGYYLTPRDAAYLITTPGATYNYGNQPGYFDELVETAEAIDPEVLSELIACIRDAKSLAIAALTELNEENYTYEETYLERFDAEGVVYTLTKGQELTAQMDALYARFTNWLSSWKTQTTT